MLIGCEYRNSNGLHDIFVSNTGHTHKKQQGRTLKCVSINSLAGNLYYSIRLPNLGSYLFIQYNTTLSSLKIADSVKSIGDSICQEQRNLRTISFGISLHSIGKHTFSFCGFFHNVDFLCCQLEILHSKTVGVYHLSPSRIFFYSVESCAFLGCSGLVSVFISDSVAFIGASAFSRCNKLTNHPVSPASLGELCLSVVKVSFQSLFLQVSPQFLMMHSFAAQLALRDVYLPESVPFMGDSAFLGWHICEPLKLSIL